MTTFVKKRAPWWRTVRALCVTPIVLLFLPLTQVFSEELVEQSRDGAAVDIVLDQTADHGVLARQLSVPSEPITSFLDGLGANGAWLLPPHCAVSPSDAGEPLEGTRSALFAQDIEGVRDGATKTLKHLVCQTQAIQSSEVAEAWFYMGVAAVMEASTDSASLYFQAIHALGPVGFAPPELGSKVRIAYDGAMTEALEIKTLSQGPWLVDGTRSALSDLRRDIPHVVQLAASPHKYWSVYLSPREGGGWKVGENGLWCEQDRVETCLLGSYRADVARWLRVVGNQSLNSGSIDARFHRAVVGLYPDLPWSLTLNWHSPKGLPLSWHITDQDLGELTLEAHGKEEREKEAEGSAVEGSEELQKVRRLSIQSPPEYVEDDGSRAIVSVGLGVDSFRGVSFTGGSADVAISLPVPLRWEIRVGGGTDLGSQGNTWRGIITGGTGARFLLRPDLGLSASLGVQAVTRGPDPKNPTVFVIEGYGVGSLRARKPFGRLDDFYLEVGGGLAPGLWRSGAEEPESFGLLGWAHLGYERR